MPFIPKSTRQPAPPAPPVFYCCDRKACKRCSNPSGNTDGCNHTSDVNHAVNFANDYDCKVEQTSAKSVHTFECAEKNMLPYGAMLYVKLSEDELRIVCNALAIAEPYDDERFKEQLEIRKKIIKARNIFAYEAMKDTTGHPRSK